MNLKLLKPKKALNKAYLKVKPSRSGIESFKTHLITLLDRSNDTESEEFHKNLVSDFLKDTYYKQDHFINTRGRYDLVIHEGKTAKTNVGVLFELKKPTNRAEMISKEKLNAKAMHELILYYLRERITNKNLEIKHLIATNIYEWFIFDAMVFDRLYAQNKTLVKQFEDFEAGRLADTTTDFFYKQIAEPFIDGIKGEIEFTYFNFQDYEKPLRNEDKEDDKKLIPLYKLLSPEHLLKQPFANDSNSLDKRFYAELLHIIGLTETKKGGKKLIERPTEKERNYGSILENAIIQLDSLDKIHRLEKPSLYGKNKEEILFNLALELCIIWINRILFLKLLEAQLLSYHKGNKDYTFFNLKRIRNFDDLNSLFFQVLARKFEDRNEETRKQFDKIPYLNSSLFEPTDIEQVTLFMSNLRDRKTIPIHSQTVLKDINGKKRSGELSTLEYLFDFLDAYDFSSEGSTAIQEDNKTLINASVLGLIFEKINGYKDGSFFTPGFVTMFMAREVIRRAAIQKFNETKGWDCKTIEDVYNKIEDIHEANQIINSLKICDPAVGSGHFLVSSLNEMIALKHDLRILMDRNGMRLKEYHLEVVNDELIITDQEGELFEYHPENKESQRVQEALFHEKQTIIENSLFGVDINDNSVKICRLRLWIELLKNAFYKSETELETLPNIDINIKTGNSLVSRFALDADLGDALKKSKWTIESYRLAVDSYRNAENKEQKREMERLIADIKSDFHTEINKNGPRLKKLRKLDGELVNMTTQTQLFALSPKEKKTWDNKVRTLTDQIKKLETEIEEIKENKIFENAFEWRFEFPEVLNDDGDFVGFDVVIGNPPYFSISKEQNLKVISDKYFTFSHSGDIYDLFVELGSKISNLNGHSCMIVSNKWLRAIYGEKLRDFLSSRTKLIKIIDFGQNLLFENAIVHTCIILSIKKQPDGKVNGIRFEDGFFDNGFSQFEKYIFENMIEDISVDKEIWNIIPSNLNNLREKIELKGVKIKKWKINFYRGALTGYNDAFIINGDIREKIIQYDFQSKEILKPILRGRDTRRYYCNFSDLWLIATFPSKGYNIDKYPGIKNHLKSFGRRILQIGEVGTRKKTNNKWFETQDSISYWKYFEKPKIIFSEIVSEPQFYYDEKGFYPEATVFFISGEKLKYLTALLNSRAATFFFKNFYMGGDLVGKIRYKKAFLEELPIQYPNQDYENKIIELVNEIISSKRINSKNSIDNLEEEIDQLVYDLYGLTEEEIEIVENA